MIRNVDLEDISDGRLYGENDLVKADTNNCKGCKKICCIGMGKTIVLDPYDCFRLSKGTGKKFEQLMGDSIELNIVDGCVLPNIKMQSDTDACSFLGSDKLCSVHAYRPGICRMFPLGRYWEDDEHFHYILQKGECNKDNLTKVKVKKWLGITDIERYNNFVIQWHKYLKNIQRAMVDLSQEQIKTLNLYNIRTFFMNEYESEDMFYHDIIEKISKSETLFGI